MGRNDKSRQQNSTKVYRERSMSMTKAVFNILSIRLPKNVINKKGLDLFVMECIAAFLP